MICPACSCTSCPSPASVQAADGIKAVPLSNTVLMRFFYRRFDGLMVVVMEDGYGNVLDQTQPWRMPLSPSCSTSR